MTVETGFVRDLQDNPHCEDVRLIFCDWLADQGDEDHLVRRRLIQIQSELANWVPDHLQRQQLQEEESQILTEYSPRWLEGMDRYLLQSHFRRGLVDVTMDAGVFLTPSFLRVAEELFDRAWIGEVRLEMTRNQVFALENCPMLQRIRQLNLSGCGLQDPSLERLLGKGDLEGLVSLNLAGNNLTDATASLLAETSFPRLRVLDLRNNRMSSEGIRRLLTTSQLPVLTRLEAQGNTLSTECSLELEVFREARGDRPRWRNLPRRLVNSLGMEFALIPPGVFLMGSPDGEPDHSACECPQHEVEITQPFYLGVYPVTQREYQALIGTNPAYFNPSNRGGLNHPVEMVTWGNASSFCEQLNANRTESLQGRIYRLPSEAEWEHACRAGTFTPFFFGSSASSRDANFDGRHPYGSGRSTPYLAHTSPVGSYPPNAFGLYDTHGNVWEWCSDFYDERFYHRSIRRDPTGPRSGTRVSARGGSWSSYASICRSASRDYWYGPHYCRDNIGFRVALVSAPKSVTPS